MRHPKVTGLSDANKWLWVQLLCVAAENNGQLSDDRHLSKVLNRRLDHLLRGLYELSKAGLIDVIDGGYVPHDWDHYQMKSDSSAERTREWRRKRNVSCDVTVTEHDTKRYDSKEIYKEKPSLRSGKQSSPKRISKRTQLEEDDYPDERDVESASRAGMSAITLDLEWQRFRAHHMAKGSLMANWNQAWVTWVTNWKSFGSKQAQPGTINGTSSSKYDWSKELAELEREKNRGDKENRQAH